MAPTYSTKLSEDPANKWENKQQSTNQQIPPPIWIICEVLDVPTEEALISIFSICAFFLARAQLLECRCLADLRSRSHT